jgi:membrane protease YdiL (CAAX protease family)
MKKALKFFGLAYLITWAIWVPMVIVHPQLKYLHLIGTLGPALAAVILTYKSVGPVGLKKWWKNIFKIKSGVWLVAVFVFPLALYYGSLLVCRYLLGENVIISSNFHSIEFAELGMLSIITSVIFYGFGEQIGWRGYALPKLIERGYNNITASIILSIFWAFWHAPLFFYSFSSYNKMAIPMVAGWYISLLLSSFLLTWIYNKSGKSVLAVAIFHGMIDVIVMMPTLNGTTAMIIINVFLMIAGGLVLISDKNLASRI